MFINHKEQIQNTNSWHNLKLLIIYIQFHFKNKLSFHQNLINVQYIYNLFHL